MIETMYKFIPNSFKSEQTLYKCNNDLKLPNVYQNYQMKVKKKLWYHTGT